MQLGLFGKLPAKGDFVTRALPAEVLQHWDHWLERALPGARAELGGRWDAAYDSAPAWRFWVGERVFGHAVAGVILASHDKVGRRFPLTVMLTGAGPRHPAPPLSDAQGAWYDALEQALLAARDGVGPAGQGRPVEPEAILTDLPLPHGPAAAQPEDRARAFFAYGEQGLPQLLNDLRDHDHQLAAATRSYWWTAGNAQVPPAFLALDGMPDATGFAGMLTGFGAPPPVGSTDAAPADWDDIPSEDLAWATPQLEPEIPGVATDSGEDAGLNGGPTADPHDGSNGGTNGGANRGPYGGPKAGSGAAPKRVPDPVPEPEISADPEQSPQATPEAFGPPAPASDLNLTPDPEPDVPDAPNPSAAPQPQDEDSPFDAPAQQDGPKPAAQTRRGFFVLGGRRGRDG